MSFTLGFNIVDFFNQIELMLGNLFPWFALLLGIALVIAFLEYVTGE